MNKVMITGATGTIGRYLVKILQNEKDYKILPVSRNGDYKLNIHDFNAVHDFLKRERPEYLIHLAWNVNSGYQDNNDNFDWVISSLNLLKAFYENGGRRAVFAGSCMEYDWRYGFLSEDLTPLNPDNFYGFSKAALYKMAFEYSRKVNLGFAWGRIFFLYGKNEKEERLVPYLIKSFMNGEKIELKYPFIKRDYTYAGDVAAAFAAILKSDFNGAVNIASGVALPLCEIANKIAVLTGNKPVNYTNCDCVNNFKNSLNPLVLADTRRLNNIIKFRPRISWEEGLSEMIKNIKEK